MLKNILKTFLIVILATFLICIVASASTVEVRDTTFIINGKVPSADTPITVIVKENSTIKQITQLLSGKYGYYQVEFLLDGFEMGKTYTVYVQTVKPSGVQSIQFYYPLTEEITQVIDMINHAQVSEVSSIINEHNNVLGLDLTVYNTLVNKQSIQSALMVKNYQTLSTIRENFYQAVAAQQKAESIPIRYYVSANGSDSNVGSEQSPFATIEKAKLVVHEYLANGIMNSDIIVYLRDGVYSVDNTLLFTEEDSGLYGYNVIYKNYPNEHPVITGSKKITGWEQYQNNIFRANVGKGWDFDILYENGSMQTTARYPNKTDNNFEGYNTAIAYGEGNKSGFSFASNDIPLISNKNDLEAYIWSGGSDGIWMWQSDIVDVGNIDYTNKIVSLTNNTKYVIGTGSKYFIQGALELLDNPGEFYLDKTNGILYYMPTDGVIANKTITAPVMGDIIGIAGSNIVLDGLEILNSNRTINVNLINTTNWSGNGVKIQNSHNITIQNCIIHDVGGQGINIADNSNDNKIYGNKIYNPGHSAVYVSGEADSLTCSNNVISNNKIYNTGLLIGHGSGIQISHTGSGNNYITHNNISDTMRYGITVKTTPYRNYVEYNDVSNANTGSDDTGVIETTGQTEGLIIRNNRVHDSDFSGGFGIYVDELNQNVVVEKNIIDNLQKNGGGNLGAAVVIKGNNGQVRNNYIVNNPHMTLGAIASHSIFTPTDNMVIERNVVYNSSDNIYSFINWSNSRVGFANNNIFYNANGVYNLSQTYVASTFLQWRTILGFKFDQNSLTTDPLFRSVENQDYRLSYNSPAYSLGIEDVDMQSIGLNNDYIFADGNDVLDRIFVRRLGDTVNKSTIELGIEQGARLELLARTINGYIADLDNAQIIYHSDNEAIASIDSIGFITGNTVGMTKITVTVTLNNITKQTAIYVLVSESERIIVDSISYSDRNNKAVISLNTDYIKATINVTSSINHLVNARAIVVLYENISRLNRIKFGDIKPLNNGDSGKFEIALDLPNDNKEYTLKILIWDGLNVVKPLRKSIVFN
jgi:parallel beta-helix repeat protein